MATESKPQKHTVDAKKKLNTKAPSTQFKDSSKDGNFSYATSFVSPGNGTGSLKENDIDQESLSYYPVNYYGYYYPVSFSERDDLSSHGGSESPDAQQNAFTSDNAPVLYYVPGLQTGYNTYSPYYPGAYLSADSQYHGQQGYFTGPMFPQPALSPVAYGPELLPGYSWDPSYIYGDGTYSSVLGDSHLSPARACLSPAYSPTKLPLPPKSVHSPSAILHGQTPKPANKASHENQGFGVKDGGSKARNKIGGDVDVLNEQNRGPRTGSEDHDGQSISQDVVIRREDYNLDSFPTKYEHAMFFVIKSYSEDDIHKSIKYNVWASTPNGNQRLDSAFQTAQSKMEEKGSKCPVFLLFSVNASGQFCGVAEMTGRVNFNKNMEFWQQDKWNGFFPVTWHIIKDVPNAQFRHIILENNDNKPVTNSRDTQEVKFSQGVEILNIFKAFATKTSILDDFGFYDNRQKAIRSRRVKVNVLPHLETLTVKLTDGPEKVASEVAPLIKGVEAIDLGRGGGQH
ncbi:evolutionarily conserved C-terminal region 8 [Wolffia australiana]